MDKLKNEEAKKRIIEKINEEIMNLSPFDLVTLSRAIIDVSLELITKRVKEKENE